MYRLQSVAAALALFCTLGILPWLRAEEATPAEPSSPSTPAVPLPGQKWALLLGADDYTAMDDLGQTSQTLRGLRNRLIAAGFPLGNVFLMCDGEQAKYLPTQANVRRQIELVPALSGEDDLLIVAFSGRVMRVGEAAGLCLADTRPAEPAATGLSLDSLYRAMAASKARVKLLVIEGYPPAAQGGDEALAALLNSLRSPPEGIAVLAARGPAPSTSAADAGRRGRLLDALGAGLAGNADRDGGNADQRVSLGELCGYVRAKLAEPLIQAGPSASGLGEAGAWELASASPYAPEMETYPTLPADAAAAARVEAISPINPQSLQALNRAIAAYVQGDLAEAVQYATDAVERDPNNRWAYVVRAGAHCWLGHFAPALDDYRQLGIPLTCFVRSPSADLKRGDQTVGTVIMGEKLHVSQARDDWLWVQTAGPNNVREGWIHRKHVATSSSSL